MEAGQLWRQYIIAGVASLLSITAGYTAGWTSPVNLMLSNITKSPLEEIPTVDQFAWIGSLLSIGSVFGPFMGGLMASKFGRKWGMLGSSVPLILGWILIIAASDIKLIYAGRLAWGFGGGMIFTISPMYCAEIATDKYRGALGSFLLLFVSFGFLLIYCIGPYASYNTIAYVGFGLIATFDILFFFMPETPIYYLMKNEREAAAQSLMKIRGKSRDGVEMELKKMAVEVETSMQKTAKYSDILKGGNFKAMYVTCALMFFQQFSGINAVLFYMETIFNASGSSIDSSISTIIIGTVQVGAATVTAVVVDRLGRKILLLFSSCGSTIGLMLLGTYFYLSAKGSPIVESIGFLPVLSLVLFIVAYNVGLGALPWALMGELLPIELKSLIAPLATAFCYSAAFIITRFFAPVAEAVGMHVTFWAFGISCIASFFFTLFVLPETKGKSFLEIQDLLRGRPMKPAKA